MQQILFGLSAACLFSAALAGYSGYGSGDLPYNYGFGYSGLAFPYIPYGYHGAKFLTEIKAAKLRGALYDGHPSRYAQFGGHGFVGYPSKAKLDYSLNGVPNAGYGFGGGGPGLFDGRTNLANADKTAGVEAPAVDAENANLGLQEAPVVGGGGAAGLRYPGYPGGALGGRVNDYVDPNNVGMGLGAYGNNVAAVGSAQAPMGAGYEGKLDPYALYGRFKGPYNGGYAQQKTGFGPSGVAYY